MSTLLKVYDDHVNFCIDKINELNKHISELRNLTVADDVDKMCLYHQKQQLKFIIGVYEQQIEKTKYYKGEKAIKSDLPVFAKFNTLLESQHYAYKAGTFEEVEKMISGPILNKTLRDHCKSDINQLPKFNTEEIFNENEIITPFSEFKKEVPQFFILVYNNKQYLINTNNTNSCRYVSQLV